MNAEQLNILNTKPDEKPNDCAARSLAVRANDGNLNELLVRLRAVWIVLAEFGVYTPNEDFQGSAQDFDDEYWQSKLSGILSPHDIERLPGPPPIWERDWAWWSSAVVEDLLKLDLVELAMPNTFYTINAAIEICGGEVIGHFGWSDSRSFLAAVRAYQQYPDEPFEDE